MTYIQGGVSGELAEVLAKTVGNAAVVTTPASDDTGFVAITCESDPGTVISATRLPPEASLDYRLRVGSDSILDQEIFCYANQNTGKHTYALATLTMSLSSAGLLTNALGVTTLSTGVLLRTQRFFPIGGQQTPLYVETNFSLSATSMATNSTLDFGLFQQSGANPYAPTDGVYFRLTSAGLFGVVCNNTVETPGTALTFTFVANRIYQFVIAYTGREAQFWIDDVLYARVPCSVTQQALVQSSSLPWAVRHAIGGTAAGSVVQGKVWSYSVFNGDVTRDKDWGATATAMGGGLQVQQGATVGGQLTTYALGAAPGASTLTASTAPATATLGGKWNATIPAGATESDFPMFSYLNPAGTVAIPGKTFVCTGIRIGETCVTTILGGPMILEWGVGFGSTAATLATTESASFAATTKIARKLHLGSQGSVTAAAVGTTLAGFFVDFGNAPISVNPGEYLHIIMRSVLATVTGACRGGVMVAGYHE